MNAHTSTASAGSIGAFGKNQSGIVLPIVLIFLVIMTLLGITSIRNVTLEEKMAGNSRYQQLAFQVAETALRSCEADVLSATTGQFFDVQPRLGLSEAGSYALNNANWNSATYRKNVNPPANQIPGDPFTARCMVERLLQTTPKQQGSPTYCPFRVTARVDSADPAGTVVVLQSYIIAPLNSGRSCPIDV